MAETILVVSCAAASVALFKPKKWLLTFALWGLCLGIALKALL